MEYYYTTKEYISSASLTIVDEEAKHLAKVLRKNTGEEIYVTDGLGNLYRTRINTISKGLIECAIVERLKDVNEPKNRITLYQSLIKSPDRFEFAIEKSVELGVYRICPVISEHTINKTTSKTERWQSIAAAAMKQSQRCMLPEITSPVTFAAAISGCQTAVKLIADETAGDEYRSIDKYRPAEEIAVFIGPEGGFSPAEIELAVGNGFQKLSLGPRKFRSETAAILAVGLLVNN
jgi:16S rRNA (uracil1498-N3)-methyltransferase